ncbi:MAG: sulfatase-like hydrolase/transferase [Flavobacteriaceae bacterium]
MMLRKSVVNWAKVGFIVVACFVMCLQNGLLSDGYLLIKSLKVDYKGFEEQLVKLGMENYISPDQLKVSASESKKNIIIISLESYEKGYLSDKYSHLTPFLRSLKASKDWSYIDIKPNDGSQWTSGSLYTYLTGFPAYFGTYHNQIFQTSYKSSITGISHIFKKAGYNTFHLSSNASISGTEDMLYALEIDKIIDKTQLKDSIQDKDLFNTAKNIISENVKSNQPFALLMATISTHFPNGVYDKRMEGLVDQQSSDLEFMVASIDYMLRDFVSFLDDNDYLNNTSVYIFPDHLKMGDDSLFSDTGERGLYVLTNAYKDNINAKDCNNLYQIDLPNIILDGAKIKHNAKFLSHYIDGDKNEYIKNHISELTSLNVSGFSRVKKQPYIIPKKTVHYNSYKEDKNRFIAHAGGMIDKYIYTNSLEALNLNYEKGFRLFELDIQKTTDGVFVAAHSWDDWISMVNYSKEAPVTRKEFLNHKIHGLFTPLDMDAINKWFKGHPDAILVTDKINEPKLFSEQFVDKSRLMMELFTWDAVLEGINTNIKSAIVSQGVLNSLKGNKVKTLLKHNITDVAISRNSIASKMELLKSLKENGIKVYVYNVNDRIDRDEDYVVKYEMDFIYGLYADKWNFNK